MVRDEVWQQAGMPNDDHTMRHFLCIGCLERRIGRKLVADDFMLVLLNDPDNPHNTPLLRSRMLNGRSERWWFAVQTTLMLRSATDIAAGIVRQLSDRDITTEKREALDATMCELATDPIRTLIENRFFFQRPKTETEKKS
jgi:hypothetical protein